ncbi:MAG: cupin domain-containing protein [Hyphomonas sp.]|nr:cupin domain-containing protein [Hyphomonas sp.]
MAKIDIQSLPEKSGTRYPPPHDAKCRDRHWRALGDAVGLSQFGVNLVRLPPGVWASQRHWHMHEDEFVWVLEGETVLVTDEGREIFRAGDCAGFPAGVRNGHHFINESDADVLLLVAGSRNKDDWGEYSDIDMRFMPDRYTGGTDYESKAGEPL